MKLSLPLFILLAKGAMSSAKLLAIQDVGNRIGGIFQDIAIQRNSTGFSVFHVIYQNQTKRKNLIHAVLRSITRFSTIVSINLRVKAKKFQVSQMDSRGQNKAVRLKGASPYLLAGHRTIIVIITTITNTGSVSLAMLNLLQNLLISSQSRPNVLVVNLQIGKFSSCNRFLPTIHKRMNFDIEILNIDADRENFNQIRSLTHHSFNRYTNAYSVKSCRNVSKWFTDKSKNLHGYKLTIAMIIPDSRLKKLMETNKYYCRDIQAIYECVRRSNGTIAKVFKFVRGIRRGDFDIILPLHILMPVTFRSLSFVKPCQTKSYYMMVPVILERNVSYDFSLFLAKLVVIAAIASSLYAFCRLFGFDRQTWQFLTIMEMIIGNGNPREPVLRAEYASLVFITAVGFFFGSNLTSGLTSTMIVSETGKTIESFEDLRKNNITVLLSNDPVLSQSLIYKQILKLKMKYRYFNYHTFHDSKAMSDHISDTVINQNLSFTTGYFIHKCLPVNDIFAGRKVVARVSNVREYQEVGSFYLDFFSPFTERFSDVFWRIKEGRTDRSFRVEAKMSKRYSLVINAVLSKIHNEQNDFEAESEVHSLWSLLILGYCLAVVSLIVEIIFSL